MLSIVKLKHNFSVEIEKLFVSIIRQLRIEKYMDKTFKLFDINNKYLVKYNKETRVLLVHQDIWNIFSDTCSMSNNEIIVFILSMFNKEYNTDANVTKKS